MYLNGKHISKLEPNDIIALIENSVKENLGIEYKQQFNIEEDKNKNRREFVRDVVSFFNTEGGCIVYGIEEKRDDNGKATGYPKSIQNIEFDNWDKLERQIYQIIRSNTDPPITNLFARYIDIEGSKVIVLGIPQKFGLPSMVTYNDDNNFLKRNPSGKYQVNTSELNEIFMEGFELRKQINGFIDSRVPEYLDELINVVPQCYLHIIPFSFLSGKLIDMKSLPNFEAENLLKPMRNRNIDLQPYNKSVYNFDGYQTKIMDENNNEASYMQVLRSGAIEYWSTTFGFRNDKWIFLFGGPLIVQVTYAIGRALNLYQKLNISPPFSVSLSLLRTGSSTLLNYDGTHYGRFFENRILLPLRYLDNDKYSLEDLYNVLKESFDIIWQSVGKKEAPQYTSLFRADGNPTF